MFALTRIIDTTLATVAQLCCSASDLVNIVTNWAELCEAQLKLWIAQPDIDSLLTQVMNWPAKLLFQGGGRVIC